ncbi:hypothetical protein NEOLEDRAFT_1139612 [Neolentinus lepideus HHB14362 ss-1]|uniref:Uncharacterized protein n=1 Tax=Neolentinus lepideus HHB14362 ss-1 TaxID=1314782 RepID=A0A165PNL2_9AGAM|nr:hypothetical protein NEOLEDRAFT_1139612 [Neolentinus lepideus HHB14362 ss-1]
MERRGCGCGFLFRRHQVCWLRLKVTAPGTRWPSEQRRLTAQYRSNQATRRRAQTHELKQIRRFLDYHDLDRADEPAFSLRKESGEDPLARYTSLAFLMSFLIQRLGASRSPSANIDPFPFRSRLDGDQAVSPSTQIICCRHCLLSSYDHSEVIGTRQNHSTRWLLSI